VFRQPTLKFDNKISGTAWIDSVKLVKLGGGPLFGAQLKEKQYVARNWLCFAKGTSCLDYMIATASLHRRDEADQ
jgi:hypothetical protein